MDRRAKSDPLPSTGPSYSERHRVCVGEAVRAEHVWHASESVAAPWVGGLGRANPNARWRGAARQREIKRRGVRMPKAFQLGTTIAQHIARSHAHPGLRTHRAAGSPHRVACAILTQQLLPRPGPATLDRPRRSPKQGRPQAPSRWVTGRITLASRVNIPQLRCSTRALRSTEGCVSQPPAETTSPAAMPGALACPPSAPDSCHPHAASHCRTRSASS